VAPFHAVVFGGMVRNIALEATRRRATTRRGHAGLVSG
jgi:hypothetical protein